MSHPIHPHELADPDVLGGHQEHVLLRELPWSRFAVLGDSVAEGVGDPVAGYAGLYWADRVVRAMRTQRPSLAYLNLGRRGLLAAEVREQQLAQALAFAPDLAAVCAGGNDTMLRRFDHEAVERELDATVGALRDGGADVLLFTLFDIGQAVEMPEPWGSRLRDRLSSLALVTTSVARRHDALLIDCATHPRAADPSIYSSDMMHLNMRGHAIAAGAAIRTLSRALDAPVEAAGIA
jgi:lysophospholipase L1-like esterase